MGSLLSTNHWSAEGKHVLITGASSGIGAELGRHFAKQGASLALLARNRDSLMIVAEECKTLGAPRVDVFSCDLTDDANIKKAITLAIENFGKFDVLILNAGRSMGCYFEEINDLESINYMLKININGVINSLFYALPSVPKVSDSRIVVMSSVAGKTSSVSKLSIACILHFKVRSEVCINFFCFIHFFIIKESFRYRSELFIVLPNTRSQVSQTLYALN